MHIRSRFKRQHVVKIFQISLFLKESPLQTDRSTKKKATPGRIRIFRTRKSEERDAKLKHALNNPISPRGDPRARAFPPWCPAGLVSAPPSDLWDTCLLIFIYSFIYSAQILARHTRTKPRGKPRRDCRDEIVHLPGGAARKLSGFRAFMGPLLGQLKDTARYFVSMMIQIVEFLVMFLFFFFLALVNGIFKRWRYMIFLAEFLHKNSFSRSTMRKEFLYKR